MKVHADRVACVGSGNCVLRVPEIFDQDENDGIVVLLRAEPDPSQAANVLDAIEACPAAALRVEH